MELKIKLIKWSAGRPVAIIRRITADKIGVNLDERIVIEHGSKKIVAAVDIIESGTVREGEIAVSTEVKKVMRLQNGLKVNVSIAPPPKSLLYIKKKTSGGKLSQKETDAIIKDIINNNLSETEIAFFVSAMHNQGMNMKEIIFLINSISKYGNKLRLRKKIIADKHSIGGVAGNRTTPLIVSICASAGLTIPKSSSRAITSAAGTADVIEAIAQVEFSVKEIERIVNKTNACMVWGGSLKLVPADSRIIKIEKMLKIDPESQLLVSIMSKKIAMGSTHILIDIPYGKTAKVSKKKALQIKRKFKYLGEYFHKKMKIVLTDGKEPIGNGVGPILELMDVIKILKREPDRPIDLEKKSAFLAGQLLELTGKARKNEGEKLAYEMLNSGKAYKKFVEIIEAQKGKAKKLSRAKHKLFLRAEKDGRIKEINNKKINSLARICGCPSDKRAGIYLYHKVGERIKKRQILLQLYAETRERLKEARRFYDENKVIKIE